MPNASPYGYDTISLLFAAFDKAVIVDSDGTLYVGRSALRSALSSISVNGQTGVLKCDANGHSHLPRDGSGVAALGKTPSHPRQV